LNPADRPGILDKAGARNHAATSTTIGTARFSGRRPLVTRRRRRVTTIKHGFRFVVRTASMIARAYCASGAADVGARAPMKILWIDQVCRASVSLRETAQGGKTESNIR